MTGKKMCKRAPTMSPAAMNQIIVMWRDRALRAEAEAADAIRRFETAQNNELFATNFANHVLARLRRHNTEVDQTHKMFAHMEGALAGTSELHHL